MIRILGFENVKSIEPEKVRTKPTLNFYQKHFHLAQRSVASKGYYETITWSFSDEKINDSFPKTKPPIVSASRWITPGDGCWKNWTHQKQKIAEKQHVLNL